MAMGPGVGGTRQWVAYSPPLSAVAITARDLPDWEAKAREMGKLRSEGKTYVMQDGDICHFLFNV